MVKVRTELKAAQPEIEEAIRLAEEGTSGEIVLVVCKQAGDYGRYESIFAFLFAMLCLIIAWIFFQGVSFAGDWSSGPRIRFHLGFVCLTLVFGFALGQLLIRGIPKLVTLFVPKRLLQQEAEMRAALAYRRYKVSRTEGGTGVLLFFAEVERVFVVLGDDQVSDKVPSQQWEQIRDSVLEGIRAKQLVSGLTKAIQGAGALLREHLPSTWANPNERPDRIYFL